MAFLVSMEREEVVSTFIFSRSTPLGQLQSFTRHVQKVSVLSLSRPSGFLFLHVGYTTA